MNAETVTPDTAECQQFLRFWMEVTDAPHVTLVSIVPDGPTITCTFGRSDLDAATSWIAHQQEGERNLYFQPNETLSACNKKPSKQNMAAALCRFADIDPLDDRFPLADERDRLMQLVDHLSADPDFPPTIIIDSGNGMQAIWAVSREPLSPSTIIRIEAETRAIETALGASGTHNIDRLLRLPGTVNFPNAKKRALGRSVSRARLIYSSAGVCTLAQASRLADHLAASLSGTGLVRPKPQKATGEATGIGDRDVAALVSQLQAAGADRISALDHLPPELCNRLQHALRARKRLAARWGGLVDDLSETSRDSSRSGIDMSLAGMLAAAKFAALDAALILCAFPHGKANGDDWLDAKARLRHVARCALRAQDRTSEAGDDAEPDRPPAFSDEALALHLATLHKYQLRYVAAWGRWLIREPDVWRFDDTMQVLDLARSVCRQAAAECCNQRIALAIASARTIFAVERLARADRRHAATVEQWDTDPWLLNTPGGVVDLRTGVVRPHQHDDYCTKIAAVSPGGDCPMWHSFLDRITAGNTELISFLQRVAGYVLTGSTREHALFFGYGTGANGKGTFINTVTGILGGYAAIAMMETFTASQGERHPTDLAMLRGARLVTAQETEEGRRWAENRIKALTGGDPISARFMRQDFFTFTPQFKLFIIGNHRPGLRNVDEAIRRRFHLVPFEVQIPPKERDHDLPEKLRAEWSGILQWMIDGCLAWQTKGLAAPAAVRTATDDYLQAEDALAHWIDERCKKIGYGNTEATRLYADWRGWAIAAGEEPGSQKRFSEALQARGYAKERTSSGRKAFAGIALNDVRPAYSEPDHERF